MFNFFQGVLAASSFGSSNVHPDETNAQPPNLDLPPCPYTRAPSPAPSPTRTYIDLSSPTRPSNRPPHFVPRPEASRRLPSKPSEDEKRLVGDYTVSADAVSLPNPRMSMQPKPGSNKGFKPVNTLNSGPHAPSRKPTTYGKHSRPGGPLIGQVQGAGQAAYLEQKRNNPPKTPSRRGRLQEDRDRLSGGAVSGKRRKVDHVINLSDDDDELLEVPRPFHFAPTGTSGARPPSARSSHSRTSIGSGSTIEEFRPSQPKSEFREVDALIVRKKARRPTSSKSQKGLRKSPFGGGSLAIDSTASTHFNGDGDERSTRIRSPTTTRKVILQELHQGEEICDSRRHEHRRTSEPFTSHHFSEARINEFTAEPTTDSRAAADMSVDLRKQHRPAPKRRVPDSSSADELAPSPDRRQAKPLSKARQAAKSSMKRYTGPFWPLAFARSYDYEVHHSKVEDDQKPPKLLSDPGGWRVRIYELPDGNYDTKILIQRQHINKVHADDTSRIRLEGPRQQDGNSEIFDLEFVNTSDFLTFRDEHAPSLTPNGRFILRQAEFMEKLFNKPLPPKNDKVGTSLLVHDAVQVSDHADRHTTGPKKTLLLDQVLRPPQRPNFSNASTATSGLTRPSRPKRSVPTYVEDSPEPQKVFKHSVEKGLGTAWAKSLEYVEGRRRAVVHFDDLIRLDEEEYLNDSLIDFYMIYLFKQLNVPADKVYFFNTYFFTKLTGNSGRKSIDYKAVERWTSKVDIFLYDYIVVPINDSQTHWYLAIICNVSKIPRVLINSPFDDDHPNIQEHGEGCTTITIEGDNDGTRPAQNLSPKPSASVQEVSNQQEHDDPNLFDEAALSLVNRGETGTDIQYGPQPEAFYSTLQEPTADITDVEEVKSSALTRQSASSAKNKNKRKPVPKKDPNQPVIVVLDSLGGNARSGAVRALKDWIAAEGKHRRGMEAVIKENGYYPKATQIPMQSNWTDCGVYLLGYVEKFFQNPDEFKDKLLTGSMSAEEDWPALKPSMMRDKMRDIIFECHRQQENARKAQRKAKNETTEIKAPVVTGHVVSVETKTETAKTDHGDGNQEQTKSHTHPAIQSPRPRLRSPFKLDEQQAAFARNRSPDAVGKISDSPPVTRSLVETPRRSSSEVCIPGKSPLPLPPLLDGQGKSPRQAGPMNRTIPTVDLISPKKRGRDDKDDHNKELSAAKKQHVKSPRKARDDGDKQAKPSNSRSREGGAPNMPIEIEDSQEVQVVRPEHHQLLRTSPSKVRRVTSQSPAKHRHGKSISIDRELKTRLEDDITRTLSQALSAPASPVDLTRTQETAGDPMEAISQSTDRMQIDVPNDVFIVRETPEPRRRSPETQEGQPSRPDTFPY
ncbi:ULP1 Protease- Ulp1 family [Pyrenophora tritici-repentis]|nr:ULP1 Protease- Ulp1 family [Pyrenophora tritici-repentis]